jgi:hypothetical protein
MTIDSVDLIKPAVLLKNGNSAVVLEIVWESDVEQFPGFERQCITELGQWAGELSQLWKAYVSFKCRYIRLMTLNSSVKHGKVSGIPRSYMFQAQVLKAISQSFAAPLRVR